MLRSPFRHKRLLVFALVLAVIGPAYALLNFTPGAVAPAATSPGAAPFFMPLTIKPAPNTQAPLPGYGDTIAGVEVGRDDKSPYVAIVVVFDGNFNPNPNPIISAMGPWWPTFPGGAPGPIPNYPGPAPNDIIVRFIYRPTNDPVNPGWVGLAGGPPLPPAPPPMQLDAAWQTCAAVAAQLDAFRRQVAAPPRLPNTFPPGIPIDPWIYLEFDPNGASPTFLECFKLQIVR